MKKLIFVVIAVSFFSCRKDKQEIVKYDLDSYCDSIYIAYAENGLIVRDTIDATSYKDSTWSHVFLREEGSDVAFSFQCNCPQGGIAGGYINGGLQYIAGAREQTIGSFSVNDKTIDKFYY